MDLGIGNINTKVYYIPKTLVMDKNRKVTISTVLNKAKALTNKSYVESKLSTLNTLVNVHVNNNSIHLNSTEHTLLSGITINNTELNNASGITDDVQAQIDAKANKFGDTLTGYLTLLSDPINSDDLSTKGYIDVLTSTIFPFKTGDVILFTSNITPTGFLRCNGARVSKSIYNYLYDVIGDRFTPDPQSDPTTFNLPDFTNKAPSSLLTYYIKT